MYESLSKEPTDVISTTAMFLLFVLFLFDVTYAASSWDVVEVLLASEQYGNASQHNTTEHHASDDFHELFDEFAKRQGIHFNKRNFRELETNISGLPVTKYGIRGIDCEKFRKFLSGIKAQKYHLQYVSVKCGPMTFSFCLAFACDPFDFGRLHNTTSGPTWRPTWGPTLPTV